MILHAGSLYKNYLVLYDGNGDQYGNFIIEVPNENLQWELYCNSMEFQLIDSIRALVIFKGNNYEFNYIRSFEPMKTLGFSS